MFKSSQLSSQWPQALLFLSGGLRAGLSLEEAFVSLAREAPQPLKSQLGDFSGERGAWIPLSVRIDACLQGGDLMLARAALYLACNAGGHAADLLERSAQTIQMKLEMAERVRSLTAQSRLSAWIVGATPLGVLGAFSLCAPDYIEPLFRTKIGWGVLGLALVLIVTGFLFVQRLSRLPS